MVEEEMLLGDGWISDESSFYGMFDFACSTFPHANNCSWSQPSRIFKIVSLMAVAYVALSFAGGHH
jgi:hypothetical protein